MATHLDMTRGDDVTFDVAVTDSDTGAVVDLTGMELTFTAKRDETDADDDALVTKTIGAGIEVTDDVGGLATITLDAVDTDDVGRETVYQWDLQAVDGDDKVRTLARGTLRVRVDITREA